MSAAASALATAIAQLEGGGFPGSNNPGNLELGDVGYGTLTAEGGNEITIFPDTPSGQAALLNQATGMLNGTSTIYTPDMTIAQAASTYTGGNPNAGNSWANSLGVSPNTTLGQLAGGSGTPATSATGTGSSFLSGLVPGSNLFSGGFFSNPERLLTAVVGLILIAAGLFSFRQTQTLIRVGGKAAAKGAELLA